MTLDNDFGRTAFSILAALPIAATLFGALFFALDQATRQSL